MGDPKRLRKKYTTPSHPWQKLRIEEEKSLMKEYGFKNKSELWKLNSKLRKYKAQVKKLIPKHDEYSEKQKQELIKRLQRLNLIGENAILEDILALTLKDICERRLQTIVVKKKLAHTIRQARQLITHEHITIGGKKITSPSYLVNSEEEALVMYAENSPFKNEDHPERQVIMLKSNPEVSVKNNPKPRQNSSEQDKEPGENPRENLPEKNKKEESKAEKKQENKEKPEKVKNES